MTPTEREAFYDAEIAPILRELSAKCRANGLSFLAIAEWAPDEQGRTLSLSPPSGFGIRWADAAARSGGNVDALIIGLMKEGREKGHNSICLQQLGVPSKPATDATNPGATVVA